jgi:glycerophosphoryl diester phosphodiesterase
MLKNFPSPAVFAHRGASMHAPENTLPSFNLALEQGADALEFDVQLSSDKAVVVLHDHTLDRTTNGTGRVRDHNLDYLKTLNAGEAYGSAFSELKIPTLEEVLENFGTSTIYNIELKNRLTPFDDLPARVVSIIKNFRLMDRILFSSFNLVALKKTSKLLPNARKGILFRNSLKVDLLNNVPFLPFNFDTAHLAFSTLSSNRIKSFHSSGKLVFAYTLNHPHDIQTALNLGVDGFFTDDPALARRTLAENIQQSQNDVACTTKNSQ